MILPALLFALFWNAPFPTKAATPPRIGFLKCRATNAEEKRFHAFFFSKTAKGWFGEHVTDDLTLPSIIEKRKKEKPPLTTTVHATFDGKIVADLKVPAREDLLPSVPAAVGDKCEWLQQHQRKQILLTTNQSKFSDPGKWHPSTLEKLGLDIPTLEKQTAYAEKCLKPSSAKGMMRVRHFEIGRIYASEREKKALIELKSTCEELKDEALDSWNNNSKQPWSIWLFRDPAGAWKKNQNLDLLDIGDFDGDGASEAVFFAGYPIPNGEFALIDLQSFGKVVLAHEY